MLNFHSPRKELARGTYVVIQINPIASCEGARDPDITALASKLSNKKYLAVITEYNLMPKPEWEVRIVSQGLATLDKDEGQHEGMCLPIFPTTEHPQGREPLRANKDFPWKNCYHHSLPGGTFLAVSSVSSEGASGITLPPEEVSRLYHTLVVDSYESGELRAKERKAKATACLQDDSSVHVPNPVEENSPTDPASHDSLAGDSDELYDDEEPYEDFSDGTSSISLDHDPDCTNGNEMFIRALEESLDPFCITPTMDVWLDLSVFDSQPIPPLEDFEAEAHEISKLYLTWKAKQEERAVLLQKEMEISEAPSSPAHYSTSTPKTDKTAE